MNKSHIISRWFMLKKSWFLDLKKVLFYLMSWKAETTASLAIRLLIVHQIHLIPHYIAAYAIIPSFVISNGWIHLSFPFFHFDCDLYQLLNSLWSPLNTLSILDTWFRYDSPKVYDFCNRCFWNRQFLLCNANVDINIDKNKAKSSKNKIRTIDRRKT